MSNTHLPISSIDERLRALQAMVLSASGWRAVFGGTDDSLSTAISLAHRDLTAVAATVYAHAITQRNTAARVVVATDTRPTGPALAEVVIRALAVNQVEVINLGVAATPEVISYVDQTPSLGGFFYISASHNPPGHNGFKLGYARGGVIPKELAQPLIDRFRELALNDQEVMRIVARSAHLERSVLATIEGRRAEHKRHALSCYTAFTMRCAAGLLATEEYQQSLSSHLTAHPLGVVGELNGSARTRSIDRSILPALGVRVAFYNDTPGRFSHQILPEGAGLDEAAKLLERHHREDEAFRVAYVPDNDGDRGNLVFIDPHGKARVLDAQTVFALVTAIELTWTTTHTPSDTMARLAVVANGPTSLRIDEICTLFGAHLFRAEVGEANVVSKARELTQEGWHVVILGEGSNGGNITPPSSVRDPLSTLQAVVKLHAFALHEQYARQVGRETTEEPFYLYSFVTALPAYQTLSTDDPRAKMQIGEISHADLKARYETNLEDDLEPVIARLERAYGANITWRVLNYEGTTCREGIGNRLGEQRGGFRLLFSCAKEKVAAVWMRGSGTEPVFRILADCKGEDTTLLDELVEWHRARVARIVQ